MTSEVDLDELAGLPRTGPCAHAGFLSGALGFRLGSFIYIYIYIYVIIVSGKDFTGAHYG